MTGAAATAALPPQGLTGRFSAIFVFAAFIALYGPTIVGLGANWLVSGEYGHGLLLLPISVWLAWRTRVAKPTSERLPGLLGIGLCSIGLLLGALAGEVFLQRVALVGTLMSLTVYYLGIGQLRAWWLPFALVASSVPLPDVLLDTLTLPLQLFASHAAVTLLDARHIPVGQAGNVIFLPGQELFVAAACSGLRSLSALLGLTLLLAGTTLASATGRMTLVVLAIPAAIGANVFRVFLTGFAAYYVGPQVTHGLPHKALAVVVFLLPLAFVALVALGIRKLER